MKRSESELGDRQQLNDSSFRYQLCTCCLCKSICHLNVVVVVRNVNVVVILCDTFTEHTSSRFLSAISLGH